ADTMDGGDGNDTYYVDNVGDIVKEFYDDALGGTADTVFASVTYSLAPGTPGNQGYGIENLTLTGFGNINATGNGKDNILKGNSGSNVLNGGAGNDTLIGGAGNDTLTGGAGADKFRFNFLSEKVDTIQDFFWTQGDKIEVSASGFGATSLSQISYNTGTGSLSFLGIQFAKIANLPAGFAVSLDVVLI
ncbi:MAG: calcium-binding protein, partial [Microcystis sp.]